MRPFFATLATESVKYSADGASMTFVNERPINYADDLVICCHARADEALVMMRNMMSRLKLTVNENKTRVCRLPEEKFDFLGYSVLQEHTDKEFIMN